ncbi:MAG TPA: hypothetical protein VGG45_20295 [Terracidiphilus sp.]
MTSNRLGLGSLMLMLISALWFSDANSAVWVSPSPFAQDDQCRWSLSVDQFLGYPNTERTGLQRACGITFLINGEITEDDASKFTKLVNWSDGLYKRGKGGVAHVFLNSEGGSVFAAINIAKAIRASASMRAAGDTTIPVGGGCYSACVIVLAGGYRRLVLGKVGIHRPFFVGNEYEQMGYKNLEQAYDRLYSELATLFKRWNLSRSLVDDMFAVASTDVHVLNEQELDSYGLSKDDWVLTEQHDAEVRAACGGKDLAESAANPTFWDSAKGEECLRKMNAGQHEIFKEKIKKLCDGRDATTYNNGQRPSQGCLDKVYATE